MELRLPVPNLPFVLVSLLLGHSVLWGIGSSSTQQVPKYCWRPGFDKPQEPLLPWHLDYALVSTWSRQEGPQDVAALAGHQEQELTSEQGVHCTMDPHQQGHHYRADTLHWTVQCQLLTVSVGLLGPFASLCIIGNG